METNIDDQSTWSRLVARGQPAVLVAACVAGGLTLTMMVIGSTPDVIVQASQAAIEAAPADTLPPEASVVSEVSVDTTVPTDSTAVADPAVAEAASPALATAPAAPAEPATVTAPGPAPAGPSPTAAPSVATTVAPATPSVVTPATLAPVTVAAPQVTAAPTTASPLAPPPTPTTAAPPPTTAAPVAASLTYPSFSAGSAGTVVLQFDGSSIYVASVNRQSNWVSEVDKNGPRTVEIKFFNTATKRDEEFHATVENGRIKVEN